MSTRPLRVLQVASSVAPSEGGPSTAILELTRHLRKRGIDARILTTDADGYRHLRQHDRAWLERQGLPMDMYPIHAPRRLRTSLGLARALHREIPGADLVHIHGLYLFPTAVATALARRMRVPYVIQPHGSLLPYNRSNHALRKLAVSRFAGVASLREASAVVFADPSEAEAANDVVPHAAARLLRFGARLEPVQDCEIPRKWSDLDDRPVVLFVGRLAPVKRLDLLIKAWPQVLRQHPGAVLMIAGPGETAARADLERQAQTLPLGSIRFPGLIQGGEKTHLLKRARVFALASESESFSLAAVEALHAGLPVVVTDRVAIHTEVQRHGAGLVIKELTPEAVASALLHAMNDLNHEELVRGCANAAAEFTWDAAAETAESIYTELCGRGA